MSGQSADLTKVTVFLAPPAVKALHRAAEFEEISRTDVINRALQLYERVVTADPGSELRITTPTDDVLRVVIPKMPP
jgi:hypothetical protein